jgi:ribonuclease BN (tRNA processing enzyme)
MISYMNAPTLTLLGTGAGVSPKPNRQSTAAALRVGDDTYIIDVGNGVGPQMVRAGIKLPSIRTIFITHHHLDHVADFGILIAQGWTAWQRPVNLVGPPPLGRMWELFQEMFAIDLKARVEDDGRPELGTLTKVSEFTGACTVYEDNNVKVTSCPVTHPPLDAYAYRFEGDDFSVVFSGDTGHDARLAEFAKGADVLVHEALYPEVLVKTLPPKYVDRLMPRMLRAHSPVAQSAQIAAQAGVKHLILSPLAPSNGVSDKQWLEAAAPHFKGKITIGRDLLEILL